MTGKLVGLGIMLVGIVVVIAAVLNSQGGFMEALRGMAEVSDPTVANGEVPGVFASFFGPDPVNLLGVVLLKKREKQDYEA